MTVTVYGSHARESREPGFGTPVVLHQHQLNDELRRLKISSIG